MADVILQKVRSIERCLQRVREEYRAVGDNLINDFTRQDAIVLNLQRACEQAIDLANHIIKLNLWGYPEASRDSFEILDKKSLISSDLSRRLKAMVGFRNLAVHEYQSLNLDVLISILEQNLTDFEEFASICLKWNSDR